MTTTSNNSVFSRFPSIFPEVKVNQSKHIPRCYQSYPMVSFPEVMRQQNSKYKIRLDNSDDSKPTPQPHLQCYKLEVAIGIGISIRIRET